jgi:hypothetical protein
VAEQRERKRKQAEQMGKQTKQTFAAVAAKRRK